ncbi:MAG TPA: hypothetical protein VGE98_10555 [Thermoanaerobaculia bacterium]
MTGRHRLLARLALVALPLLLPVSLAAQETYNYSISALGGVGGSIDASPGSGYGHPSYQLNLMMLTEPQTLVGFRLGHIGFDKDRYVGTLTDADLSYVTIGGEYRTRESWFDSGIFVGLGAYRMRGIRFAGDSRQEQTSIGGVVGLSSEFRITHNLALLLELAGHYADLKDEQFFATAHGGLSVHF